MKMNLLISHEWLQQLAGTLLHFLWQGALVAFLCAVLLRLLAARSSILRYSVAVASLGVMTLLPIMTFILYPQTHEVAVGVLQFFGSSAAESGRSAGATNVTWWSGWIVRAWGIGVCLGGVRLVAGWMFSRRLVRSATTHVPARVSQLMERVREVLVGSRRIRLLIGERVDSPVIFGWLRPVILLPVSAITGLTEDQLMAVIAHEVAHIRRHDFIVNAAQRVVESVLFYHPALWWLSARVRAEREHCCDDLAVQLCGNQFVYAEALLELERTRTAQSVLAVPAAAGNLGARVRRVLGVNSVNRDWQPAAVALLLVAICVLAGAWQSETIAAPARAEFPAPPPPLATQGTSSAVPAPETSASVLGALTAIVTAEPPQRGAAIPPVPATSIQLTVELRDGSRIVGKSNDDSVEVRSAQLGAIRLPIDKIRLIEWSATPEPAKLTTSGGEVLAVQFVTKEVRVETSFGVTRLAADLIRRIEVSVISPARPVTRRPGLVSLWSGEGNAEDSAGDNPGTLTGDVSFNDGKVGRAFAFNNRGYVRIPASPSLRFREQITIAFWMKADRDNPMETIQGLVTTDFYLVEISNYAAPQARIPRGVNFILSTNASLPPGPGGVTTSANYSGTADGNYGLPPALRPGEWYHIAATYDGSKEQLYINGRPWGNPTPINGAISEMLTGSFLAIGAEDGRTTCSSNPRVNGNFACNGGRYFKGLIDQVALFNHALSASEIEEICVEENAGALPPAISGQSSGINVISPPRGSQPIR